MISEDERHQKIEAAVIRLIELDDHRKNVVLSTFFTEDIEAGVTATTPIVRQHNAVMDDLRRLVRRPAGDDRV